MDDKNKWISAEELVGVAGLPNTPEEVIKIATEKYWHYTEYESKIYFDLLRLPKQIIDTLLFDRVGLRFSKNHNSDNTQTWFTSKELINVGGVSDKTTTITSRARTENWIKRSARRGNTTFMKEYHVSFMPEIMQLDLGFIPKDPNFRQRKKNKWVTAKQIAGLSGMPTTASKISEFARRHNWTFRVSQVGFGIRPFEYNIDTLPEKVKEELLKKQEQGR